MNSWPAQAAQARFSEFLDKSLKDGPRTVTRFGAEVAVLVPIGEWKRMREMTRPTLKELLLTDSPTMDIPIPARGRLRRRPIEPLD